VHVDVVLDGAVVFGRASMVGVAGRRQEQERPQQRGARQHSEQEPLACDSLSPMTFPASQCSEVSWETHGACPCFISSPDRFDRAA
jgi:hypothetical protein